MMFYGRERRSKAFLVRLLVGVVTGQTPEEFAGQEIEILENDVPCDDWYATVSISIPPEEEEIR